MTLIPTLSGLGRVMADAIYRVIHREDDSFSVGIATTLEPLAGPNSLRRGKTSYFNGLRLYMVTGANPRAGGLG